MWPILSLYFHILLSFLGQNWLISMCNVSQDAHCLSVHSSLIVISLFVMTLAFFLLSLSNFREILIGFVIASVCTCFISRVLNDQRVNVGHLNELQWQCLRYRGEVTKFLFRISKLVYSEVLICLVLLFVLIKLLGIVFPLWRLLWVRLSVSCPHLTPKTTLRKILDYLMK